MQDNIKENFQKKQNKSKHEEALNAIEAAIKERWKKEKENEDNDCDSVTLSQTKGTYKKDRKCPMIRAAHVHKFNDLRKQFRIGNDDDGIYKDKEWIQMVQSQKENGDYITTRGPIVPKDQHIEYQTIALKYDPQDGKTDTFKDIFYLKLKKIKMIKKLKNIFMYVR